MSGYLDAAAELQSDYQQRLDDWDYFMADDRSNGAKLIVWNFIRGVLNEAERENWGEEETMTVDPGHTTWAMNWDTRYDTSGGSRTVSVETPTSDLPGIAELLEDGLGIDPDSITKVDDRYVAGIEAMLDPTNDADAPTTNGFVAFGQEFAEKQHDKETAANDLAEILNTPEFEEEFANLDTYREQVSRAKQLTLGMGKTTRGREFLKNSRKQLYDLLAPPQPGEDGHPRSPDSHVVTIESSNYDTYFHSDGRLKHPDDGGDESLIQDLTTLLMTYWTGLLYHYRVDDGDKAESKAELVGVCKLLVDTYDATAAIDGVSWISDPTKDVFVRSAGGTLDEEFEATVELGKVMSASAHTLTKEWGGFRDTLGCWAIFWAFGLVTQVAGEDQDIGTSDVTSALKLSDEFASSLERRYAQEIPDEFVQSSRRLPRRALRLVREAIGPLLDIVDMCVAFGHAFDASERGDDLAAAGHIVSGAGAASSVFASVAYTANLTSGPFVVVTVVLTVLGFVLLEVADDHVLMDWLQQTYFGTEWTEPTRGSMGSGYGDPTQFFFRWVEPDEDMLIPWMVGDQARRHLVPTTARGATRQISEFNTMSQPLNLQQAWLNPSAGGFVLGDTHGLSRQSVLAVRVIAEGTSHYEVRPFRYVFPLDLCWEGGLPGSSGIGYLPHDAHITRTEPIPEDLQVFGGTDLRGVGGPGSSGVTYAGNIVLLTAWDSPDMGDIKGLQFQVGSTDSFDTGRIFGLDPSEVQDATQYVEVVALDHDGYDLTRSPGPDVPVPLVPRERVEIDWRGT